MSILTGSTIQHGLKDPFCHYFPQPLQPTSSTQRLRDLTSLKPKILTQLAASISFLVQKHSLTLAVHVPHFSVWFFFVSVYHLPTSNKQSLSFFKSQGNQFEPLRPVILRECEHIFGTLQFCTCEVSVIINIFFTSNNNLCSRIS